MDASKSPGNFDVIVIGAGFAGIYMLHRAREAGFSVVVLEAGSDAGGTWFWNRYPGARCDVPSLEYSYSFSDELQQEWSWSEHYAKQEEIERYVSHVLDRFDLTRDIRFDVRVTDAFWIADDRRWQIHTEAGDELTARFCITALGGYSAPIRPDIEGLDSFGGELYYTSAWPRHDVDFTAKCIGVVGTGSSGMQTISALSQLSIEHLYVFQRTPNFCVPGHNRPLEPEYERTFKESYADHRERNRHSSFGIDWPVGRGDTAEVSEREFLERMRMAWERGGPAVLTEFSDILVDEAANERVADFFRADVRRRVHDPKVAELLCPFDHYIGARRILVENGYLEVYNQPNVSLVDVRAHPIERITPNSLVTTAGTYDLDTLILATGFDSGSGPMLRINFEGWVGSRLAEWWSDGYRTFLGMAVRGFPNMLMIAGPGSPGIRAHGIVIAEQQVEWITRLLTDMRSEAFDVVEPLAAAEEEWTVHVQDVANASLVTKNDTQYVGANVPGKPRVYAAYLGGVGAFRRICEEVRGDGYAGFAFDRSGTPAPIPRDWTGRTSKVRNVYAI